MRIGILTLPFNNNYGGYLQAYALMKVLKDRGHEVEIINRRRNAPSVKSRIKYFLLGVRGLINKSKPHPFFIDGERAYVHRGQRMLGFVSKYMSPMSDCIFTSDTLRKDFGAKYDAYIIGSDQVWRPIYVPDIEDYFFRFVTKPESKKIVYAASFGNESPEYNDNQIATCGNLATRIDAIGLREDGGFNIIKKFEWDIKCPVEVVLDPTMLLDSGNYERIIEDYRMNQKHTKDYLFAYLLDSNEKIDQITERAMKKLDLNRIDALDSKTWEDKKYIMPSIEEWLFNMANSSFVVTDSFHGTVFSILFNKPFVVCANTRRGASRFETLLGHFGLTNRIVNKDKDVDAIISQPIDWEMVNDNLSKLREKSLSFLFTNLESKKTC